MKKKLRKRAKKVKRLAKKSEVLSNIAAKFAKPLTDDQKEEYFNYYQELWAFETHLDKSFNLI